MNDRIVLITNVEHFVGRPVAAELAAQGVTVVCHDQSFADAAAAAEFETTNPALTVVRAQAPAEIVAAATETCGRIDVVVCNDAGAAVRAPIEQARPEDMRSALEEMVVFPFEMARAVVPQMKARKQGKILFITSATPLRGLPNYSMYVTARGATNALTVSLAQELGRDNIQVNAIAPNYVESPTYFPPALVNDPETFAKMIRNIPLKRLGKPEEVAALVAFYASDKSDFITGHVMPFAGAGLSAFRVEQAWTAPPHDMLAAYRTRASTMSDYTAKPLRDVALTDHLRSVLDRLDASTADIETCITLPSEVYTSEAWFEFEKRAVWDREWVCLGHIGQIPEVGDYFSITINDDPLLVLRDGAGEVRVMTAVCQHRGHILGEHTGNTKVFTCPHHGWSYDLSGTLISAPMMDVHASLDELRRTSCLPTLRSDIWNGFVFINMDGNAPPLNSKLRRLTEEIANHHLGEMGATPTCDFSGYPWNWKSMQENAVEPHHTWFVHKGPHDFAPSRLATFVEWDDDDDGAVYHPTGFLYKDGGFTAGFQSLFPIIETLTDAERQRVMFASIMPNLFIGTVPDGCLYYMILPDGANSLTLRVGYLFPHSTLALDNFDVIFKAVVDGIVIYNDQDTEANTAVHKGLRSRFANRGRYAPLEGTLPQINRWLVKRYKAYAAQLDTRSS